MARKQSDEGDSGEGTPQFPDPFDYRLTKDGRMRIFRGGREVVTLSAKQAERLAIVLDRAYARGDQAGDYEAQVLLAKATGNYKRGNERR